MLDDNEKAVLLCAQKYFSNGSARVDTFQLSKELNMPGSTLATILQDLENKGYLNLVKVDTAGTGAIIRELTYKGQSYKK